MTQKNDGRSSTAVLWALVAVYIGISIVDVFWPALTSTWFPFCVVGIITVFTFTHGIKNLGAKTMFAFFAITFVVSWSYETLSILTGFPFGHYHYSDQIGPKLWLVPLLIMPAYFGVIYQGWMVSNVLLDRFSLRLKREGVFLVPFISSFVVVMWDLVIDPTTATISKSWIWENGGAYFGVPFVNYLGWFLCVYTISQLFAIYHYSRSKILPATSKLDSDKSNWLLPVALYGASSIGHLLMPIVSSSEPITSLDQHVWWTGDIVASASLIAIFTMVFVTVLAVAKIVRNFSKEER